MKLAILGLGRSGVSAAKAALKAGDTPVVYDEKPAVDPKKLAAKAELEVLGVEVRDGWPGGFDEAVVITSPGVPRDNVRLTSAVAGGKEVISEIEYAYRISKAPIVAITGTNGKSTTTVMTYLAARGAGFDAVLCGNIYGSGYPEIPLSEAAAASTPDQVLVAEVSSFQLEWVRYFKPVVAAITNITADHLDRYASRSEYTATKLRIFAAQRSDDFMIVPANRMSVDRPDPPTKLTFASRKDKIMFAFGTADAIVENDALVVLGNSIAKGDLPFVEEHNFLNACLALLAVSGLHAHQIKRPAQATGTLPLPTGAIEGLKSFKGLAHRMEFVGEKNGVRVINNSMCTNVQAILSSAQSISGVKHLLMGGINKQLDFNPVGALLQESRWNAYLYGRDRSQINAMMGGKWPEFETMQQAFEAATMVAKPGEVIMLSPGGASFDQFEDFRDRGNVFKQIAKDWLDS